MFVKTTFTIIKPLGLRLAGMGPIWGRVENMQSFDLYKQLYIH